MRNMENPFKFGTIVEDEYFTIMPPKIRKAGLRANRYYAAILHS